MGRSAGPGSPVSFKCSACRSTLRALTHEHTVTLTGRTRPYRGRKYSMRGVRSTGLAREYTCSCGHTGWSNHVDLAHLAGVKE